MNLLTVVFLSILVASLMGFKREVCRKVLPELESSYSLNASVIIDKLTTKDRIFFKFRWLGKTFWPNSSAFIVINLELESSVFKYQPASHKVVQESRRIKVIHLYKSLLLHLDVGFAKNEDDESRWAIAFQFKDTDVNPTKLCTFFVRADQTPFVTLEHEPLGKGRGLVSKYHEDDKIKVTCTLNKANPTTPDPPFNLVLPDGSVTEDVTDDTDKYTKSIIIVLTLNIQDKPISCWVFGGDNVSDSTITSFTLKKMQKKVVRHTTMAISIAVFLCILLFGMTFVGAYLLIVKQRADTTKELIAHHTHVTQMNTQMQMTNMTAIKFKASRMSRVGDGSSVMK